MIMFHLLEIKIKLPPYHIEDTGFLAITDVVRM